VVSLAFGPPSALEEDVEVVDPLELAGMTRERRARLAARLVDDHPELASLMPARNGEG
jgi:hypothetical protein